jgi:NAD(P)-dependent dehydrogenase (short-subunit alcohol dehydrogenase family)
LEALGTEVEYVTADVGDREDVRRIAEATVRRFGGFDTWINDAGRATYGKILDTPVWRTCVRSWRPTFWGIVHGSLEAIAHLRDRPDGGKLINLGQRPVRFRHPGAGPLCRVQARRERASPTR